MLSSVLTGSMALAFDPQSWAKDDINTCITSNSYWTSTRKTEANAAPAAWESQIDGLNINHSTSSCPESDVEMDWVTHLDGDLGTTRYGLNGPLYIRFAKKYSSTGNSIPWSFDGSPTGDEYDFRSTAIHEVGHALGLKHPEVGTSSGAQYPFKSWDGLVPTMKGGGATKGTTGRRVLKQDDRSGGFWSGTYDLGERQYFPRTTEKTYWTSSGGSLTNCGTGFYCLTKASGSDYSYMWKTTRMTTDSNQYRSTPRIEVTWRRSGSRSGGTIRIRLRRNSVSSGGNIGSYIYAWATSCSDNHSDNTWETCSYRFDSQDFRYTVQDFRVYVYNYTGGSIDIQRVRSYDNTY